MNLLSIIFRKAVKKEEVDLHVHCQPVAVTRLQRTWTTSCTRSGSPWRGRLNSWREKCLVLVKNDIPNADKSKEVIPWQSCYCFSLLFPRWGLKAAEKNWESLWTNSCRDAPSSGRDGWCHSQSLCHQWWDLYVLKSVSRCKIIHVDSFFFHENRDYVCILFVCKKNTCIFMKTGLNFSDHL